MIRPIFIVLFFILSLGFLSVQAEDIELTQQERNLVDSLQRYVEKYSKDKPDMVLDFAEKMESYADKNKLTLLKARSLNAQASVYYYRNDKKKAAKYFEKELAILEKLGDANELADSYFNLATLDFSIERFKDAAEFYEKSLTYARKLNNKEMELEILERLALTYQKLSKYEKAFNYYKDYVNIREEKQGQQIENEILTLRTKFVEEKQKIIKTKDKVIRKKTQDLQQKSQELEVTKVVKDSLVKNVEQKSDSISELHINVKQKDLTIKEKVEQVAKQKKMIYNIGLGLIIVVLYVIILFRQYKQKIKVNRELTAKNEEIMQQKEEIEAQRDEIEAQNDFITRQNQDITDSIHYAKQIQTALMPEFVFTEKLIKDYFILFRPRDIVSGDFYWCAERDGMIHIAAADCTGHGVPGAFMSMLGLTFLDEVIIKDRETRPDQVLNSIRNGIIKALKQHGLVNQSKDGMDITLITIDTKKKIVQFAGANNPIYVIKDKELIEYKGDRMPVSYYPKMNDFTLHEFPITPGMILYLFSDGFADQFGGPEGSKFKYKPFKNLLLEHHNLKMDVQSSIIEQTFTQWHSGQPQIDDVMVMGIKF